MLQLFNQLDSVAAPTETAVAILKAVGLATPVQAISCGVDSWQFRPRPELKRGAICRNYGLGSDANGGDANGGDASGVPMVMVPAILAVMVPAVMAVVVAQPFSKALTPTTTRLQDQTSSLSYLRPIRGVPRLPATPTISRHSKCRPCVASRRPRPTGTTTSRRRWKMLSNSVAATRRRSIEKLWIRRTTGFAARPTKTIIEQSGARIIPKSEDLCATGLSDHRYHISEE